MKQWKYGFVSPWILWEVRGNLAREYLKHCFLFLNWPILVTTDKCFMNSTNCHESHPVRSNWCSVRHQKATDCDVVWHCALKATRWSLNASTPDISSCSTRQSMCLKCHWPIQWSVFVHFILLASLAKMTYSRIQKMYINYYIIHL